MNIRDEIKNTGLIIDKELEGLLAIDNFYLKEILEAMSYSLFTGGKRVRPILCLRTYEMFSKEFKLEEISSFALAIELIHTYSLVHDDLPSMDDDDYRRGKLSNHKKYGEAMAILAGDALLNLAFENISDRLYRSEDMEFMRRGIRAMAELGKYSGVEGMIGGQVVDLHTSKEDSNREVVEYMYRCKTSALIQAAIVMGAIVGGAGDDEVEIVRDYAYNLGMAFQLRDDLLDLKEDEEIEKVTYISTLGYDEAAKDFDLYNSRAKAALDKLDRNTEFLVEFTNLLSLRKV